MQSFFRLLLVILFIIVAFVGGWLTSDLVKQDPFLSNIFPVKNDQYERFVNDITEVIQEVRMSDQTQLLEQILNQQAQLPVFSNQISEPEIPELSNEWTDEFPIEGEVSPDSPSTSGNEVVAVANFEPTEMIGTIIQQMSAKEKLTFLLWARSRFTDDQLIQIQNILQEELTPESFIKLYQYTRKNLKGSDFEYLLSFVDRYLNTLQPQQVVEDAIPVFQASQ